MSFLAPFFTHLDAATAQNITYACIGMFIAIVVNFVLVVFVGGPKPRVRFLIYLGLGLCVILGLTSGYLYLWHHYFRT